MPRPDLIRHLLLALLLSAVIAPRPAWCHQTEATGNAIAGVDRVLPAGAMPWSPASPRPQPEPERALEARGKEPMTSAVPALVRTPLSPAGGGIRYMNAGAPPSGNGLSWATAFQRLQDALAAAAGGGVAQIWVAEGTYRPHTSDRNASFALFGAIEVYGGFAGTESSLEERDPAAYPCILSGDLRADDLPAFSRRTNNSRHVVTASEPSGARLDGFIVERGNADFDGELLIGGGGMYVVSTGGSPKLIRVTGCSFRENSAGRTFAELGNFGGALLVRGTDAEISGCRFEDNRSNNGGAVGLFHRDAAEIDVDMEASIQGCEFVRNDVPTQGGGALWTLMGRSATGSNQGTLEVTDCLFEANHAGYWGAWVDQNTTFLTVAGCEFRSNHSDVAAGALGHLQTGGVDTTPRWPGAQSSRQDTFRRAARRISSSRTASCRETPRRTPARSVRDSTRSSGW